MLLSYTEITLSFTMMRLTYKEITLSFAMMRLTYKEIRLPFAMMRHLFEEDNVLLCNDALMMSYYCFTSESA